MINNNDIKNLLISSDTIPSQNLITAEWNMNKYQVISNYGMYTGKYNSLNSKYEPNTDSTIKTGKLYLIYDDDSYKVNPDNQYYSNLASVFEPDRPDPGIVLLTYVSDGLLNKVSSNLSVNKINSASARFYPFSKSRKYDYFNSARFVDPDDKNKVGITAAGAGGAIENTNIFVVYENSFPCNKIVIKMQDYNSVPNLYAIDVLDSSNNWNTVFSKSNSNDIVNGILEIYYKKVGGVDTWDTTPSKVDNLSEIETPTNELTLIKGIRFRVGRMQVPQAKNINYRTSLELIEISPRIEADLTNFTENISIQSSIGDSDLGLPVGNIVSGNGSILLSNENNYFLMSSKMAEYKMLSPNVEFKIYQIINVNNNTYNVPLRVMYSKAWDTSDDWTATVQLVDKMTLLSERKAVDMSFVSRDGMPMSAIILFLLDNCGITGYEFKPKTNSDGRVINDTLIRTFFCKKEETITEVLQKIAVATQSCMFFDAFNNLNVLTKEKITEVVSNNSASFWLVMDEDYNGYTASNNFKNYLANVISTDDEKIQPITSGKIEYHAWGVNKSAGYSLLQDIEIKDYIEDNPFLLLTGTGYGPKFTTVWSSDQTSNSVLGTGALIGTVSNSKIKNVFTGTYIARTQEDAVNQMYAECLNNSNKSQTLLIPIDSNDIYYFDAFNGYVMIDQEIISYNGKVFSINGVDKILFNKEQLLEEIAQLSAANSSIIPTALVIDVIFNPVNKNDVDDDKYNYTIKDDGRAQFGTDIAKHVKDPTDDYIVKSNITSFVLGETYKKANNESFFKNNIQKYYDFSKINNWAKVKQILGFTNSFKPYNYNGLLKLTGPPIPDADRKAISGSATIENQNKIDDKVSPDVGDFAPFVYTYGEKNVYIQKITDIGFNPSVIATKLKLITSKENQSLSGPEVSAHSSIAGMGFALKEDNDGKITNGYFLEVESFGSAGTKEQTKDKNNRAANVRFYRVTKNSTSGKLIPDVLAVARANIIPSLDTSIQFNPNEPPPADQVVSLEVRISLSDNGKHKFSIYYGNRKIKFIDQDNGSNYIDDQGNIIDYDNTIGDIWYNGNARNIFMFVRNDTSVVFDYMLAAISPNKNTDYYYNVNNDQTSVVNDYQNYITGSVPNKSWFNDNLSNVKYYDFANVVREVKKYTIRYDSPVLDYKLIDISRVNPKYRIIKKDFTSMGAELIVLNTVNEPISLGENSSLPLYIIGTQIEEITKGEVSMDSFYDKTDEYGKKKILLSFNKSLYGEKTFNFSSDFIQSIGQANDMMGWVIKNCNRERFKMSMEIMFNPLLELGDKVKVFSSSRGYYEGYNNQENTAFGNKTFIVSEINHSISTSGVSTNISIIEVGE